MITLSSKNLSVHNWKEHFVLSISSSKEFGNNLFSSKQLIFGYRKVFRKKKTELPLFIFLTRGPESACKQIVITKAA